MSSIHLITLTPMANAVDVSPASELFLAISVTGVSDLSTLSLDVNGERAFSYAGGTPSVLTVNRPAYQIEGGFVPPAFAFLITRRRRFDPGTTVTLRVRVTASGATSIDQTTTFSVAERIVAPLDPSLRNSRVDQPFTKTPALDVFRANAISALRPRFSSSSAVLALFHAVYVSQLRCLTRLFGLPVSVVNELPRLPPEDLSDTQAAAALLDDYAVLWEAALKELLGLGVSALDVQLLFNAQSSSYPQERIAAVCAALLLAAKKLVELENPAAYTIP